MAARRGGAEQPTAVLFAQTVNHMYEYPPTRLHHECIRSLALAGHTVRSEEAFLMFRQRNYPAVRLHYLTVRQFEFQILQILQQLSDACGRHGSTGDGRECGRQRR